MDAAAGSLQLSDETAFVLTDDNDCKTEVELAVVPKTKRQRRVTDPMKSINDILKEKVAPNCVVVLSVVPCQNGILEKSSKVRQYNQTFQIERLFFDSQHLTAMADLQLLDDDLVALRIPASRLELCETDFHKNRQQKQYCENAVDKAFQLLAAVKRALGFVKRSGLFKRELCEATELNRELLGFSSGKNSSVSC